jgi:hypothetical protein
VARLAGVAEHLAPVDLEALAELKVRFVDELFEQGLALDQLQPPEIVAIQIKQIESDHDNLGRSTFQFVLQNRKVGRVVGRQRDDFTIDDRGAGVDMLGVRGDLLEAIGPVMKRRLSADRGGLLALERHGSNQA